MAAPEIAELLAPDLAPCGWGLGGLRSRWKHRFRRKERSHELEQALHVDGLLDERIHPIVQESVADVTTTGMPQSFASSARCARNSRPPITGMSTSSKMSDGKRACARALQRGGAVLRKGEPHSQQRRAGRAWLRVCPGRRPRGGSGPDVNRSACFATAPASNRDGFPASTCRQDSSPARDDRDGGLVYALLSARFRTP